MSIDTWTTLTGGNWSNPSNWSLGVVPGTGDDAMVPTLSSGASITLPTGNNTINSLTLGGNLTVAFGSALTINRYLTVQPGVTLTDNGTLTFATGDTVTLANYYNSTEQIVVGTGGLLNAANTNFSATGGTGQINVNSGGRLQASNCTFAASLNQVELNYGSIFKPGDLTGDFFSCPLFLPATDVQYLSSNGANTNSGFQDIDILAGTFSSGTLALNAISSSPPIYVFPGNFTVGSGATLNVDNNLAVRIQPGVTLTDNGTLSFTGGDTVSLANYYNSTQQIVVGTGGLLKAATTTFSATGGTGQINVASGGHLQASSCTFAASLNQIELNNGSIVNAGDLVGNLFDCPLFLPASDVQYLSSGGANTNLGFQNIDILAGEFSSGTLALNAISSTPPTYIFPGNFTVTSGAKISVDANLTVQIQPGVTLTDNGTLTFANGDTVSLTNYYNSTQQIVVGAGGTLKAAYTTFSATGGTGSIIVDSGGHLQASNCTFAVSLNQIELNNGSILNTGDLIGNVFNCPLFLPASEIQYLSSGSSNTNAAFQNIDILPGTLSGRTVTLYAIGSASPPTYIFAGNFTIAPGATLAVAANLSVQIQPSAILTDSGTLTFSAGDIMTMTNSYGSTQQIVVGAGGRLNASETTFNASGGTSLFTVNSAGNVQAIDSTFALSNLTLNAGSAGTIQYDTFSSQLTIDSGTTVMIAQNDMTNVPGNNNGILAVGSSTATINLANNYWGTTIIAQIDAKINDRNNPTVNPLLPTVQVTPFLTNPPVTILPAILPVATVGNVYDAPLTVGGGVGGAYTVQITGLPSWLTLGAGNVLQGTPTKVGSYLLKVTATDSSMETSSLAFTLKVDPALTLGPATLPIATIADNFSTQLTATGGSGMGYSFSTTSLPSWLTLSPGGLLTGTPPEDASSPLGIPITVTDANNGTGTKTFALKIDPALTISPTNLPVATVANRFSVQLTAAGGSGSGYTFKLSGQPAWLTLTNAGLLRGTPPAVPGSPLTVLVTVRDSAKGTGVASFPLTIDPAVAINPRSLTPATVGNSYSISLSPAGGSGAGYTLTPSGLPSWLTLSPGNLLQGTPNQAGTFSFHVLVTDSNGAVTNQAFALKVDPALIIHPLTLPVATVGNNLLEHLIATGGAGSGYTFTSSNLPTWMALSTAGLLSGTPPVGTSSPVSITVAVTDRNNGTGSTNFSLAVDPPLTINPTTLPMATPGVMISVALTAAGGTGTGYDFTGSGLPSWLSLSSSGLLSGTPPTSATGLTYTFTVKVKDSIHATGSAVYTLIV